MHVMALAYIAADMAAGSRMEGRRLPSAGGGLRLQYRTGKGDQHFHSAAWGLGPFAAD